MSLWIFKSSFNIFYGNVLLLCEQLVLLNWWIMNWLDKCNPRRINVMSEIICPIMIPTIHSETNLWNKTFQNITKSWRLMCWYHCKYLMFQRKHGISIVGRASKIIDGLPLILAPLPNLFSDTNFPFTMLAIITNLAQKPTFPPNMEQSCYILFIRPFEIFVSKTWNDTV